MRNLSVQIEINGSGRYVGAITETAPGIACFSYAAEYLSSPESRPISVSLHMFPLNRRPGGSDLEQASP